MDASDSSAGHGRGFSAAGRVCGYPRDPDGSRMLTARLRLIAAAGLVLAVVMHWYFTPYNQCLRAAGSMGYGHEEALHSCSGEER
jgi:hypothetical protein